MQRGLVEASASGLVALCHLQVRLCPLPSRFRVAESPIALPPPSSELDEATFETSRRKGPRDSAPNPGMDPPDPSGIHRAGLSAKQTPNRVVHTDSGSSTCVQWQAVALAASLTQRVWCAHCLTLLCEQAFTSKLERPHLTIAQHPVWRRLAQSHGSIGFGRSEARPKQRKLENQAAAAAAAAAASWKWDYRSGRSCRPSSARRR